MDAAPSPVAARSGRARRLGSVVAGAAGARAAAPPRRWLVPIAGCLLATGVLVSAAPGTEASAAGGPPLQAEGDSAASDQDRLALGRALYATACVSCHGVDGRGQDAPDGSPRGPTLEFAGEAGAYYQISTGRMPLANPGDIPSRKEPAYSPEEVDGLVAYVASLGDGPARPEIDIEAGALAEGGVLYRENCQACHSATGAGGALSYGRAAPPLAAASPDIVGAAVRSGPGPMPRYGEDILDERQLDSVARYVTYLDDPDDRGGLALGGLGPIPEGFLVWVGGLGLLLVAAFWMGTRRTAALAVDPVPPADGDADADPGTEGVDAGGNAELARAEEGEGGGGGDGGDGGDADHLGETAPARRDEDTP